MILKRLSLLVVFTFTAANIALSQTQPKSDRQELDKVLIGTTEVVLDAIVRDKKGRPVTNLSANDFEVYEDGVRQRVASFRLVTRSTTSRSEKERGAQPARAAQPGLQGADATSASPPSAENQPGAVALVFDRLSANDARARARSAALAYLAQGLGPRDYVAVFRIDQSLSTVQAFTNDERLIRQAVDRVSGEGTSVYISEEKRIAELWDIHDILKRQEDEARQNGDPAQAEAIGIEKLFIDMRIRTATDFERIERDQQGLATPSSLLSLINGLSTMPGRKAIVLFSNGIAIPPSAAARFRAVISNANRANVSIYTVDAAGLRAESADAETGKAIGRIGQERIDLATSADDGGGIKDPIHAKPMMRDLERNEDLVRKNPEGGLRQLARDTGGVAISSTNDPGPRLRQVNEDLHSYYLLSYVPQNSNYDGRFRQISLKITRPGMEVQGRKGYFALRESYDSVLEYEAPALAILSGKSVTDAFQTHCAAFSFPEPARPGLVPVVVEVPAGSMHFLVDNAKTNYRSDFSVVVLIRNESQQVVRKLSSHYLVSGAYDKLAEALSGNILFYKETRLDPGKYTIASIVYDALANLSSTANSTVEVPAESKTQLQLSSLVLLKNAERLSSADNQASRLFHVGETLLYPNLGEPVSKTDNSELKIFITVYVPAASPKGPQLLLEFGQKGKFLGQYVSELATPDQTGRIQYTGSISLHSFWPGEYEIRATVTDGVTKAVRSERFSVQP